MPHRKRSSRWVWYMRIAFLADIHANFEAMTACLAGAREQGADRIVFLGDIVGYGADPAACVDAVREACVTGAAALMGNHDEAILGTRFRLSSTAQAAIDWTKSVLSAEQRNFLADLPLSIADDDRLYVHASAHAPEKYPYIQDVQGGSESLRATEARLTVCGHVHVPQLYHIASTGKVMGFMPDMPVAIPLSSNRRWLAVMGSVGQPRDGNPAAAFGIFDSARNEISYLRAPYDVATAAAKIRRAGLPDTLWKRLELGR